MVCKAQANDPQSVWSLGRNVSVGHGPLGLHLGIDNPQALEWVYGHDHHVEQLFPGCLWLHVAARDAWQLFRFFTHWVCGWPCPSTLTCWSQQLCIPQRKQGLPCPRTNKLSRLLGNRENRDQSTGTSQWLLWNLRAQCRQEEASARWNCETLPRAQDTTSSKLQPQAHLPPMGLPSFRLFSQAAGLVTASPGRQGVFRTANGRM